MRAEPAAVLEVKAADGEVLFALEPAAEQVVDPAVAYLATDMLKGVITRGTGRAAAIGRPAAGKTGTTQAYRDAWFVGYTPHLATAVWVGHTVGQVEMRNVHGRKVTGGSFPAEIWAAFMKSALSGTPADDFVKPSGLTSLRICRETGQEATEYCEDTGTGLFVSGSTPGECEMHAGPTIVELPNLIGLTKEEAIAILNQLQLLFEVDEQAVSGVPAGIVSEQDPGGGSEVTTDTVISVVVSTGEDVGQPPVPSVEFEPDSPTAGTVITFDASGSTDDGAIVSWLWEFDDGAQAEGEQVDHAFALAGDHEVTLWVTDDDGDASSLTITVTVG
jgi:membrane peptidoglycan carboxypeptidase